MKANRNRGLWLAGVGSVGLLCACLAACLFFTVISGTINAEAQKHQLVGHWRYTDILSSGDFSLVTDYHLVLDKDGNFIEYYFSADDSTPTLTDEGRWSIFFGALQFVSDTGGQATYNYQLQGSNVLYLWGHIWDRLE